jgi:GT2 family glycosyltransferase
MTDPRVSILIATSNRPDAFERCLRSVIYQTYENIEVIVLDYSEDINTCEQAADIIANAPVKCTHVKEPYGVAGSRNWLMDQASGDIYVFIDDDACFADNHAIERVVDGFEKDVGIQAFKIIDNPDKDGGRPVVPITRSKKSNLKLDEHFRVSYFVGAGHAFKREIIEECGDYKSDLMYGMEELDLSYRAIEHGWTIRYNPAVVIHHYPGSPVINTESTGYSELHYKVANRIYFAVRYLPARYVLIYMCIWLGYYAIQAVQSLSPKEYLSGIKRGVQLARSNERTPMSSRSIEYLRENHGRLWY